MRRLQPFFDGLDRYSKVIEILCNGTPYLSYIWVSKARRLDHLNHSNHLNHCAGTCKTHAHSRSLGFRISYRELNISQLAVDFVSSFDKLIGAYARIAENLPRFDRLSVTFQGTSDFQQVLAMVYSDILEFHRRAYKFFRRRGKK